MSLDYQKRIAIVDDEPNMRSLLKDFLTAKGYQVECFSSSTTAFAALESKSTNGHGDRFTAIISDVNMGGGMNGMEFLRSVRSGHPDLPFFLITAHSSEEQANEAKRSGVSGYLTKPFPLSRLAGVLESVLRQ